MLTSLQQRREQNLADNLQLKNRPRFIQDNYNVRRAINLVFDIRLIWRESKRLGSLRKVLSRHFLPSRLGCVPRMVTPS